MTPLERDGYEPDWCQCGHPAGDHRGSRSSWPQPDRRGVCLVHGCQCQEYMPAPKCGEDT